MAYQSSEQGIQLCTITVSTIFFVDLSPNQESRRERKGESNISDQFSPSPPTPFIGEVEGDVFLISYSGASIYKKMSLGAINGPARFVFTKMTPKATNVRQIYIILQTSKLCNRIKSTRPNS